MAEALLNHQGRGRLRAFSAGSQPKGEVHPLAIETLGRHGIAVGTPRSKNWDEFAQQGTPAMDLIVTVCDNAAGEVCPIWPGHPATAHWSLPDPAAAPGSITDRQAAFERVFEMLRRAIERLLASSDRDLATAARSIGSELPDRS